MSKDYPRIKYFGQGSKKRKTCQRCGGSAKPPNILCLENNYFRGDDDVFKVCKECQKSLKCQYGADDVDAVLLEIGADREA